MYDGTGGDKRCAMSVCINIIIIIDGRHFSSKELLLRNLKHYNDSDDFNFVSNFSTFMWFLVFIIYQVLRIL